MTIPLARDRIRATASIAVPALPKNMGWMAKARCLKVGTEVMHPPGKVSDDLYESLKAKYCYRCPVRGDCLMWILNYELEDKYVSHGIWAATPKERKLLLARIRGTPMCRTEIVRRWLKGYPIPAPNVASHPRYVIVVRDKRSGSAIFEGWALKMAGAHLQAVREMTTHGAASFSTIRDLETDEIIRLESRDY